MDAHAFRSRVQPSYWGNAIRTCLSRSCAWESNDGRESGGSGGQYIAGLPRPTSTSGPFSTGQYNLTTRANVAEGSPLTKRSSWSRRTPACRTCRRRSPWCMQCRPTPMCCLPGSTAWLRGSTWETQYPGRRHRYPQGSTRSHRSTPSLRRSTSPRGTWWTLRQ